MQIYVSTSTSLVAAVMATIANIAMKRLTQMSDQSVDFLSEFSFVLILFTSVINAGFVCMCFDATLA